MEAYEEGQRENCSEQITIYLRIQQTKKGTDFTCEFPTTESQFVQLLFQMIEKNKFLKNACQNYIKNAAFVVQGRHLNPVSSQTISLRPNSIIHLINSKDIQKQSIPVIFRYQNLQQNQDISHSIEININSTIEGEVQKITSLHFGKSLSQLSFVYLGAEILPVSTFKEAHIGQNSEIIVIDKLKNQKNQDDAVKSAQEIPFSGFEFKPRKINKKQKEQPKLMGLNFPYNPKLQAEKVTELLQENVEQYELFIQQQHNSSILQSNPKAAQILEAKQEIENQTPLLILSEQIEGKMNLNENIPTNEEIQAEEPQEKIEEELSSQ